MMTRDDCRSCYFYVTVGLNARKPGRWSLANLSCVMVTKQSAARTERLHRLTNIGTKLRKMVDYSQPIILIVRVLSVSPVT